MSGGHGDGAVVSHDFHGALHDHFRDDRIDLARHDGTALLTGRQADFADAAMRAGIHEAQVVGDFHKIDGQGLEQARHFDEDVVVLGQVDGIFCRGQADARQLAQLFDDFVAVLPRRRVGRADSRTAEVDHAQAFLDFIEAPAVTGQGLGIGAELFAHRHGDGIHELCPAQFIRLLIGLFFVLEGFLQVGTGLAQLPQLADGGNAQGRRIDVVRRLAAVDVIQWMDDVVLARLFPNMTKAALAMTSLTFMFVDVPAPPCRASVTKASSY